MVYACKIDWFLDDETMHDEAFVVADSMSSCVELIDDYYGEKDIDLVTIEPIASGGIIPIEKDSLLFESVRDNVKEQAIW